MQSFFARLPAIHARQILVAMLPPPSMSTKGESLSGAKRSLFRA